MAEQFIEFLRSQPVLTFWLVIGLGYVIGRIGIAGITLGPPGGVLIAGLLFGHFGFTFSLAVQAFGFALFIFCVGYQAGPRFFDIMATNGLKYLSLALVVAAIGFALAASLSLALGLAPGFAAGMLGGALTTTPTLAAAQDAVISGLVTVPPGMTSDQVLTNIGAGYALTYLFGMVGVILVIRLLPKLLRIDLPAAARELETALEPPAGPDLTRLTLRSYRVTRPELLHRTVGEAELAAPGDVKFMAIQRDGRQFPVTRDTRLELGDEVVVLGSAAYLLMHAHKLGEEIAPAHGPDTGLSSVEVVVTNRNVVGIPLSSIRPAERIAALPLEVRRQRTPLPLNADLVLRRGDVVTFYAPDHAIDTIVRQVGYVERKVDQTDLLTFGLGIVAGVAIGTLGITVGGIRLSLGMATGLLFSGLVIGFLRSIWPVFGRVPSAARWVLGELGLLILMAGIGVNAGGGMLDIIRSAGLQLIGAGALVTLIPPLAGYAFSRKVLKLNPAEALGGVCGAMTSGAALGTVLDAAKSNVPALGYTGAYAFASIILALSGTLMMVLV
jgi:putative transport protein